MRVFDVPFSHFNDDEFKKTLKEINKINAKNIDDMDLKDIDKLIELHEKSSISLRKYLEYIKKDGDDFNEFYKRSPKIKSKEVDKLYKEKLPVFVEIFSTDIGNYLHIFTPFNFRRGMKNSFDLASYLNAELIKFEEENAKLYDVLHINKDTKLWVQVLRVSSFYSNTRHNDNDNLELSEMINVIFGNLCISDNVLRMSLSSDYIQCKNEKIEGLHIFITPYERGVLNAQKWLEIIENNDDK